jgi:hypothetical protein
MFRSFTCCAIVLFLTCGSLSAETQNLGTPVGSIPVPRNLSAKEVQEALIKAADGRGWTLVSRDDESVVVRIDRGDWSARIAMVYNTAEVQLFSNSTRKGKPKLPENWLKYLKHDATRILTSSSVLKE